MARRKSDTAQAKENEDGYLRCIVEIAGRRCRFPASLYYSANAKPDDGVCRLHYRAPGIVMLPVIIESELWYDARKRRDDVPLTYTDSHGRTVPGYSDLDQLERQHAARVQRRCAEIGLTTTAAKRAYVRQRLAGVLRPREPGEDDGESLVGGPGRAEGV